MVFVNTCNSVSGVAPRCGLTSFTHTSWVPVEPDATGLPSELRYFSPMLMAPTVSPSRTLPLTLARRAVAEHLVPERIDKHVIEHYVRKALRYGAWRRLPRESRLLLWAVARYINVVKSPVLRGVIRGFSWR